MVTKQIQILCDNENITPTELERLIGASKGVLSRSIKNETDIQAKWLKKIIIIFPRYVPQWLLTGEGNMVYTDIELDLLSKNALKNFTKNDALIPHQRQKKQMLKSAGKLPQDDEGNELKLSPALQNVTQGDSSNNEYSDSLRDKTSRTRNSEESGLTTPLESTQGVTQSVPPDPAAIPLIPVDAMAGWGSGDAQVMDYDAELYVVPEFTRLKVDFMIAVRGDSMTPHYSSGDLVACRKLEMDTFFQWNKIYVLDTAQGAMIKRVRQSKDEKRIVCISENKDYDAFELDLEEDVRALALVVGVIRFE